MFHDGCTAGPLSDLLSGLIGACCVAHDIALDRSYDLGTFIVGNWDFFVCAWQAQPLVAVPVLLAVSGPIGLGLYLFGPKRPADSETVQQ